MSDFRYLVRLAFDGTEYHGWQIQKTASSVQEVITDALKVRLKRNELSLVGCGRTDTGVHAKEFYAHFDHPENIEDKKLKDLAYRLNRQLPNDIVIFSVTEAEKRFHARFTAISRTYKYYIHTSKDPFLDKYSWSLWKDLDIEAMNKAASILFDYDDFTSFARLHSQTETNICRIKEARWDADGHRMVFTITADRFLRNMVRAIVGTLVDVGLGKVELEEFRMIIEARDRGRAGKSAPARGLFLDKVKYPRF
jgi:tRNA pseudouridine38-40 synthase